MGREDSGPLSREVRDLVVFLKDLSPFVRGILHKSHVVLEFVPGWIEVQSINTSIEEVGLQLLLPSRDTHHTFTVSRSYNLRSWQAVWADLATDFSHIGRKWDQIS